MHDSRPGSDDCVAVSALDLPDRVCEEVYADLAMYSVVLVAVDDAGAIYLRGSGTIVRADSRLYILTATHVWEQLSRLTTIGVPLAGGVAPYLIPRALMIGVAVGQRRSDEWGPDLTLIRIPSSHVARIEAHKVAYNLTMRADSVLRDGPAVSEGCWVILGAPDERAQLDAHGGMLNEMAAFGAIAQTHARDGFDYVDFGIDRTGSSVGAPVSFGGVSGGGLWQICFERSAAGDLVWNRQKHLEGVAFYQSAIVDGRQILRCHARRTLYEQGLVTITSSAD
jgi:hypothetical protein